MLADFEKVKALSEKLEAKQEMTDSALREAQTEKWTNQHPHKEVCRTLRLSQQMHKGASESAAKLAEKFEALGIRYDMSRKASERLLADSWQANASKNERIKILTTTLPSDDFTQALENKQIELHNVESRVVVTRRLVETLDNQLSDAKTKHSELEMENKKLEYQLEEAKVRLDYGSEDETCVKAELEKAKADIEEHKQCASDWRYIAVAHRDEYTPDFIGQTEQTF